MKTKKLQYITKGDTAHIFFCGITIGTEILGIDRLFFRYTTGRKFELPSKRGSSISPCESVNLGKTHSISLNPLQTKSF